MKIRFVIAVASCFSLFGLAGGQIAAADEPNFVPSPRPGIKISNSAVQFATGDAFSGDGNDDLAVLDPGSRQLRMFRNADGRSLELRSRANFRSAVGGWDSSHSLNEHYPLMFGVTNPLQDRLSVLTIPTDGSEKFKSRTQRTGAGPADVIPVERYPLSGYATANEDDDTVSFSGMDLFRQSSFFSSTPVGSQPVAIATGGIRDDIITANRGSDDVSILKFQTDQNGGPLDPVYGVRTTLPVGAEPVDVVPGKQGLARGAISFLVVNRGSDSVTTIRLNPDRSYSVGGEYPVGRQPVSATAVDLNHDEVPDFVVANSGSDDLSLLISENGDLVDGGRIEVGDKPVAVAAMDLNQFFEPDLVVANAGDGTVTSLLWNETSGECQGRPARLRKLSPDADRNYGSSDPDQIYALGGDDTLRTGRGGDCVFAGDDDDFVSGGSGDDRLSGGPGDDELSGENGSDVVRAGAGEDVICEPYGVELSCGSHALGYFDRGAKDRLFGESGEDWIQAGKGPNLVRAGAGNDRVIANDNGFDRIDCGPGKDEVRADRGDRLRNCEVVRR